MASLVLFKITLKLHLKCKRMSVVGMETDFVLPLVETYDSVFLEFRAWQKMIENTCLYFQPRLTLTKKVGSSRVSPFNLFPHSAASAASYDLSIYTSAFASVLGVIDLRVEIHTSEINEYLFFFFDDQ